MSRNNANFEGCVIVLSILGGIILAFEGHYQYLFYISAFFITPLIIIQILKIFVDDEKSNSSSSDIKIERIEKDIGFLEDKVHTDDFESPRVIVKPRERLQRKSLANPNEGFGNLNNVLVVLFVDDTITIISNHSTDFGYVEFCIDIFQKEVKQVLETTFDASIILITKHGLSYQIQIDSLCVGENLKISEFNIAHILSLKFNYGSTDFLILLTKKGFIKKLKISSAIKKIQGNEMLIKQKGDSISTASFSKTGSTIFIATANGWIIKLAVDNLIENRIIKGLLFRSENDIAMALKSNSNKEDKLVIITENGFILKSNLSSYRKMKNGHGGVRGFKINEETGLVADIDICSDNYNYRILSNRGQFAVIDLNKIPSKARASDNALRVYSYNKNERVQTLFKC